MKKLFMVSLLLLLLGESCKKNSVIQNPEVEKKYATLTEVKKVIMKKIIYIAKKNPVFKKTVEAECLKQVRGDYNVALEKIIQIDQQTPILPVSEKSIFISLVKQMKDFRPNEMPIIFVPVMESRDPKEISKNNSNGDKKNFVDSNNPQNYITMVDQDNEVGNLLTSPAKNNVTASNSTFRLPLPPDDGGGNPPPPPTCSAPLYYAGYIISDAGALTYSNCINEALAWNTDVWVLGYEEVVSPGNRIASSFDGYTGGSVKVSNNLRKPQNNQLARTQGLVEYGGMIQVTNLGNIESWVQGKPEFYHYVYNSTSTLIHSHPYGKLKRSHFNNNQWTDLHCTIGIWNTSAWGDINYERWIEEDGGDSAPIAFSSSYVSNGITYSISISTPAKSLDENLGITNVQFNDPLVVQVPYAIGNGPFKYNYYSMNMLRNNY